MNDKLAHFLVGVSLFAMFHPFGLVVGAVAVVGAGIGKEVYDRVSGRGDPEVLDAVATIAGGAALLAWLYLITLLGVA